MNFYVYQHVRLDTDQPFYVGKGHNKRAWSVLSRNQLWNRIVKKYGYRVEIIENNLSEDLAFQKEIELIDFYKSIGCCEANLAKGGRGIWGIQQTRQHIVKRAVSKGSRSFLVWKAIRIKRHYKRDHKAVYCKGDFVGKWVLQVDCAKILKIPTSAINVCLKHPEKHNMARGYIFEYEEANNASL